MVVDNDRTTLEMVQIRLDVAGYHPRAARSSYGALDVLRNNRPDVLILERNMPEIDGLQLLRELSMFVSPNRMFPVLLVGRTLAAEEVLHPQQELENTSRWACGTCWPNHSAAPRCSNG